jgi:hypothetical protein
MAAPDRKPFLLRIDPQLHAELETWAAQELRSLNGQIEFLLREAVRLRRKGTDSSTNPAATRPSSPRR